LTVSIARKVEVYSTCGSRDALAENAAISGDIAGPYLEQIVEARRDHMALLDLRYADRMT
jgi:hypothetical protein